MCRSIVYEVLQGVHTPERPSSPAELYITEEQEFLSKNPKVNPTGGGSLRKASRTFLSDQWSYVHFFVQTLLNISALPTENDPIKFFIFLSHVVWHTLPIVHQGGPLSCISDGSDVFLCSRLFSHTTSFSVTQPVNGPIHRIVLFDISLAVGKPMICPLWLPLPSLDFMLAPFHFVLSYCSYIIAIIIHGSSLTNNRS